MKKFTRILLGVMLTGQFSFGQTEFVPLTQVRMIADQKAMALWGKVSSSEPLAYYSKDDELIGYRFTYAINKPFPEKEWLKQQCDEAFSIGDHKLQWGIGEYGTIFVGARKDLAVIQDHSKALSPEYAVGLMMEAKAKEKLGETISMKKAYYIDFQNQWFCYTNGTDDIYVKAFPKLQAAGKDEFQQIIKPLGFFCIKGDFSSEWNKYLNREMDAPAAEVWIPNHDGNCKFYDWSYGCSPTAAAMLLSYWDYVSAVSANNYSKLIDYYFQRSDGLEGETDYQVPNTNKELAIAMNTDTISTGLTDRDEIAPGYTSVCNTTNGYNFTCTQFDHGMDYDWYFSKIISEIGTYGRPVHISIPGHSECCVAYDATTDEIGVHNTWYEGVQWISKTHLERVYTIIPGGAEGYAIELTYPLGDVLYNHNGSGETLYAGDVYEITWNYDYLLDSYVRLYYSTNGGYNWTTITSNTPNDGAYDWVAPAGINSTTCRIRVHVYSSTNVFSGSDASTGNLKILPGGSLAFLVRDVAATTTTDPDYYQFTHSFYSWCAVGTRANTVGENWNMQMFSDITFTPAAIAASTFTYPVDFVVMDGNHSPMQARGIKPYRVSGTHAATVEYDGSNTTLVVGDNNNRSWPAGDVVEMRDIHLVPGYYKFSMTFSSGSSDLGMGLYGSSGAAYYANRSSYLAISDNSGGAVNESFWITIATEDDYGLCVWANDALAANFNLKIEKTGQWLGTISSDWHTAGNWAASYIPTTSTDVAINTGYTYFPIVSSSIAYCNNITIGSGAILRVNTQTLSVAGDMTINGQLEISSASGNIDIAGSIFWEAGSTANFTANGRMYVDGDWEFREGAHAQLGYGYVYFHGTSSSYIRSYEANCSFKSVLNSKSSGYLYLSAASTDTLKITGYFDNTNTTSTLYDNSTYPLVLKGELYNYGHIYCLAGTFIFGGYSQNIDLNTGDYFNNLVISSSSNTNMIDSLRVHGNLAIESGALVTNNYPILIRGNWTNNVGNAGFAEGTSMTVFEGSVASIILTGETFYYLKVDKTYAGYNGVEVNDSVTVTSSLNIQAGTMEMNPGSRLYVDNQVLIASGAGLNANDNNVEIYSAEDWYDSNLTPTSTEGFDAGIYSVVHFLGKPSNYQTIQENCPFNDVIIEGTGLYARPNFYDMTCKNLNISSGTFRLGGYRVDVNENVIVGGGTLRMDNAADSLVITGDITWQPGSNDLITTGKILVGSDWTFQNGTNAVLGTGNTVVFNRTLASLIRNDDPDAAFGNLVIGKPPSTSSDAYIHASSTDTIRVAGTMTVNAGNQFHLQSGKLIVDGMLDIQSTAETDMSARGYLLNKYSAFVLNGLLNVGAGSALVHGTFELAATGELGIAGGSFTSNDAVAAGAWQYLRGIFNLSGGTFEITNNSISIASTATTNISGGTIICGTAFGASNPGTFQPTGGKLKMIFSRTGTAYIYCSNGNYLYDLELAGKAGLQTNVTVKNDVLITSGYLSSETYDLYVEGNWTNNIGAGGFLEYDNTVHFTGPNDGDIATDETFYDMEVAKTNTNVTALELLDNLSVHVTHNLAISDGSFELDPNTTLDIDNDLTINNGAGLNANDTPNLTINVGGNWSNGNTSYSSTFGFNPGYASLVTFDGLANQFLITACAQEDFNNLRIFKSTGEFKPNDNLRCFGDIDIMSGTWEDNLAGLYHKVCRHFTVGSAGAFLNAFPLNTVEFLGPDNATLNYISSTGCFHNLVINKNTGVSVTPTTNLNCLYTGNLTIENGECNANGKRLWVEGDLVVNDAGILSLPAASSVIMSNTRSFQVNSGGRLDISGTQAVQVSIKGNVPTARYALNISSGGTIAADYCIFKNMFVNGVYVGPGSMVDPAHPFKGCTFQDGTAGGTLLGINNDQVLTIRNAVFPANTGGCNSNVAKTIGTGHVYFVDFSGDFSGEDHDADGFNLIDWVPTLTASGTAEPGAICYGNTSQLNVTRTGGLAPYSYHWSPSAGLSDPNVIDPIANPAATTTYYVTVTDGLGTAATGSVVLTVNPLLPVSVSIEASANPSPPGNHVTFTATPVNGGTLPSYQWKLNGNPVGTGLPTYSYVPGYNDHVTCVLTSNAQCPTGSPATSNEIIMIIVARNTAATGTIPELLDICFDASDTITVAGGGNIFVIEDGGRATMIAGKTILYLEGTKIEPGGYMHGYITTTNSYCGSLSPAMVAVVSGVEEFTPEPEPASRMFAIYPNPTSGTFTLMDKGEAQPERVHVEIFDMQGGRIMSTSYTGEKNHHFTLNGLPSGLYFLKVIAGDQAESFKLIITR